MIAAAVVVGIFFLLALWSQVSEELRESRLGHDLRFVALALGIVLAWLLWTLFKGPAPAAAP